MAGTGAGFALFSAVCVALAWAAVERRLPVPTIAVLTVLLSGAAIVCAGVLTWSARTTRARVALGAVLALAILPGPWLIGSLCSRLVNDWRLSVFARQLVSRPPPGANAELRRAWIGQLSGNGNHCDYVVEVRIEGDLPQDEIVRHFETLRIQPAVPGEGSSQQHVNITPDPAGGFTLMFTDAPNAPALDWRCR